MWHHFIPGGSHCRQFVGLKFMTRQYGIEIRETGRRRGFTNSSAYHLCSLLNCGGDCIALPIHTARCQQKAAVGGVKWLLCNTITAYRVACDTLVTLHNRVATPKFDKRKNWFFQNNRFLEKNEINIPSYNAIPHNVMLFIVQLEIDIFVWWAISWLLLSTRDDVWHMEKAVKSSCNSGWINSVVGLLTYSSTSCSQLLCIAIVLNTDTCHAASTESSLLPYWWMVNWRTQCCVISWSSFISKETSEDWQCLSRCLTNTVGMSSEVRMYACWLLRNAVNPVIVHHLAPQHTWPVAERKLELNLINITCRQTSPRVQTCSPHSTFIPVLETCHWLHSQHHDAYRGRLESHTD